MLSIIAVLSEDAPAEDKLDSLIRQIGSGSQDALADLYTCTRASVYGFSLSILKHSGDAEDVLHDTYLRIWSSAAGYASKGTPMSWILTITKNLALMKLRERSRRQDLADDEWASLSVPGHSSSSDDRALLEAALEILSDDERSIVMLHAVAGLKHREISALIDLALPTVLSKYHRALKKLRVYLEGADE